MGSTDERKYGHKLTPEEQAVLYEKAWHDFDMDQSGYLDKKECKRVLEAFAKIKMRVLTRRWEKASQAPHNALELKELKLKHDEALAEQKALIAQLRNKDSNKLDEKFQQLDINGDGQISKDEFFEFCHTAYSMCEF